MDNTFQYGGNQSNGVRESTIIALLKDYIDVALYKNIKKENPNTSYDKELTSNVHLWDFLLKNEGYPNQTIKIKNFFLLEWIPTSPGQYFTKEASDMRRGAMRRSRDYVKPNERFIELRPNEKESMVRGGLGSLRIGPKKIEGESQHVLCLSSNAISHEGIPILINQTLYLKVVNQIKENGLCCVNLIGSLRLLPSDNFGIKLRYGRNVPKYCIQAEDIELLKTNPVNPQVSLAILYNKHDNDWGSNYGHSFCTFEPIKNEKNLKLAIDWLNDYAIRYSEDKEPNVIGDFDEYYEHFSSVDLPLIQIANGHIPYDKLKELQNKGNLHFEIIQGDKIQSGDNSVIINRSTINLGSNTEIAMKDKILFLTSNPADTSRLRIDKEVRDIQEGLKRSNKRENFEFEIRVATRPRDLSRAILDENPQILHFSGHGEVDGIILEDEQGISQVVTTDAIAGLFSMFGDTIKCVILNSCYSEKQATEIAKHIPYVIGMSKAVPDNTAISFATSFYDALGAGKDIAFAFKFGVSNISLEGLSGNEIPILLRRP